VDLFVEDDTRPVVLSIAVDMNVVDPESPATLTLVFEETVNGLSFKSEKVTLQTESDVSGASAGDFSYSLSAGKFVLESESESTEVKVSLSASDVDELKIRGICKTKATCYAVMTEGALVDMNGLKVQPLVNGQSSKPVDTFTADGQDATLVSFDLSLQTHTLSLTFSEAVLASSLSTVSITVQNLEGGAGTSVTLSAESGTSSQDGAVIQVTLSVADSNAIKKKATLAVDKGSTWLSVTSAVIQDMGQSANKVTAIEGTSALEVTVYEEDATAPVLVKFGLDMSTDVATLTLEFSETVRISSLFSGGSAGIVLQSNGAKGPGDETLRIASSEQVKTAEDGPIVTFELKEDTLDRLRQLSKLAKDDASLYLWVTERVIEDMKGNDLAAILEAAALKVSDFAGDVTSPTLVMIAVDMDDVYGTVTLEFSEPMKKSSFVVGEIGLQTSLCEHVFTFSQIVSDIIEQNDRVVVFGITLQDSNIIKANRDIAASADTTFIALGSGAITDMAGNAVVEIASSCKDSYTTSFTPDTTAPVVEDFELNMNDNTLTLTLSETIPTSSVTPSYIILNTEEDGTGQQVSLSSASTVSLVVEAAATVVVIDLGETDVVNVKLKHPLGFDVTFLSFPSNFLSDFAATPVQNVLVTAGMEATKQTIDATPPELVSFSFNFETDIIEFQFSEPIDAISLDLSKFIVQDRESSPSSSVSLGASSLVTGSVNALVVAVDLDPAEADAIKLARNGAVSQLNLYLAILESGGLDVASNGLTSISGTTALQVSDITADTVNPKVVSFEVDLDAATIMVVFSEVVKSKSFSANMFGLQDSTLASVTPGDAVPSQQVRLTGSTTLSANGAFIIIDLNLCDLNSIKSRAGLARSQGDTYLFVDKGALVDLNNNPLDAIVDGSAIQASGYKGDSTKPQLKSWQMSMDPNGPPLKLHMQFDEVVDVGTFDVTKVQLQDKGIRDGATKHTRLTGGEVKPGATCCDGN